VIGYLPDYRLASVDPAVGRYLTDLVYFSAEPDPSGDVEVRGLKPEGLRALKEIKSRHRVALHLCVGGWGRSRGFARLAAEPRSRERFAVALTRFCLDNGFDGADLDWEHPAGEAQERDYAALLAAVRKRFEPHKFQLSVAVAGWQGLPGDAVGAVDRLHLMAYDARGRHATYEHARDEVARLVKRGVPPAKICLGVPLYGRGVDDAAKSLTYGELVRRYNPAADVDEVGGIYFNGIGTIRRKTKFALEQKLGGVMAWEVGQDASDGRSLLRAIAEEAAAAARGRK
jgi:GH18 family chitinase